MATITTENDKITLTTTIDPSCNDVYDVVMYVNLFRNNIDSGWFIRKNGKVIPPCEMLWDDRFVLHSIVKREFATQFADPNSNFTWYFSVLITQ